MTMPPMNEVRCGAAAVFYEEDLYVFGGESFPINTACRHSKRLSVKASKFSTSFEKFTSEWVSYEFPFKRSYFAAQLMLRKIYLIGGYAPHQAKIDGKKQADLKEVCKSTIVYDPETNSWENIGKLNEARACFGCGVERYTIYVVGGIGRNESYLTSTECLLGGQSVWTVVPQTLPINAPDAHISTCFCYGCIYVTNTFQKKFFRKYLGDADEEYKPWDEED